MGLDKGMVFQNISGLRLPDCSAGAERICCAAKCQVDLAPSSVEVAAVGIPSVHL